MSEYKNNPIDNIFQKSLNCEKCSKKSECNCNFNIHIESNHDISSNSSIFSEKDNLDTSFFSEYNYNLSNIDQLDGNDTVASNSDETITNSIAENANNVIIKSSNFRIIETNVNSLKGKKNELKAMLQTYQPDCVVLVETKLDENYCNSEFFDINKWNIIVRNDRNIHGGGVIIAVLRKYIATPVKINYDNMDENPELYFIKLHSFSKHKPVYICGFYRSQRDARSVNMLSCLHESLRKLPGKKGNNHVVLTGDANLHINWELNQPQVNSFTKKLDKQMLDICNDLNLVQKVNFPTRHENTLDLFLTSDPSKVMDIKPIPPLADHDGIVIDLDLSIKKKTKSQHIIYKWKKADSEGLTKYVAEQLSVVTIANENSIDENWNKFKNILIDARDKFVPKYMSTTRHNLPWYHQHLRRLCNKKQRLYNKSRKTKSNDDIRAFKKCRSEYNKLLKNAQREYYLDFLEPRLDQNGKYLFNYIKRMKKDSLGIEALNHNNKLITNASDKAEALSEQYKSVFAEENKEDLPHILPSPYPDMKNIEITEKGVLKRLEDLDVNKSTGPDGLSPILLKMLAPVISQTLTEIFQQSLRQSTQPSDWLTQFVSPILKPGKDKLEPSSYRPISLTSVCCKILEHIIYSETMQHLENNNILSKLQHGYRRGCSTETQLLKVIQYLSKNLENCAQTDIISLDFSKAFDVVPHSRLLLKMNYYGVRNILPWIKSFLTNRKQTVIIDGVHSSYVHVKSGLPQGTVLAGLLFLIFINDLPSSVTSSFTGVFCDDTLLAKEILSQNDAIDLQNDLDKVHEWTKIWGMSFNVVKCVQMTVSNKIKNLSTKYFLENKELYKNDVIKYLGIFIDKKLTFKQHIEEKSKRATTVLNMLRRNLHFAPKSVKTKAFQSCVLPIVEYGSTCWAPTSSKLNKKLEMVVHNGAKFVTNKYPKKGNYDDYSITKILKDLNWKTLEQRRMKARTIMAYNILNNNVILEPTLLPKVTSERPERNCKGVTVGRENQLVEPQARLDIVRSTFFYATPTLWNQNITPRLAKSVNVETFKRNFRKQV